MWLLKNIKLGFVVKIIWIKMFFVCIFFFFLFEKDLEYENY